MPDALFIYGTLHPDRAPAEIAPTVALLRPAGPATLRGQLLNLGPYPGLLLPGDQVVQGELFALPEDRQLRARVWRALDSYEDFRPESPETSLFIRVLTQVALPSGDTQQAWVYLFNQPVASPV
jgi:gamma-glutamylcyclotransferase (GGCT)/AIG2-like uncharacterized protein YtfP